MSLNKFSLLFICFIVACSPSRKSVSHDQTVSKEKSTTPSVNNNFIVPPAIIYKTKMDYKYNVPITLSDDGKTIVSYPAPSDLYYKGSLAYPTQLANGYLLDNRGVSLTSVFTKYTYEEYSKLTAAPDMNTLYASIIDKNPFLEMYNCGNRNSFTNEVNELNGIITSNELDEYKRLK